MQQVYELLPKQAGGLEATSISPQRRSIQQEPLQFYLREPRRLALQLMATAPKRGKARDRDYRRLDKLVSVLHLPEERLTVQCHNFLAHYQARLLKHGNLQVVSIIVDPFLPLRQYATYYTLYLLYLLYTPYVLSSEGGEHTHQDVKGVVSMRRSKPRWKCPIALQVLLEV